MHISIHIFIYSCIHYKEEGVAKQATAADLKLPEDQPDVKEWDHIGREINSSILFFACLQVNHALKMKNFFDGH